MAIKKCNYCGKPFNSVGAELCAACTAKVDDAYIKARKYIYQNPGAKFASIVEDAEISEKALRYLVDTGRLEVKKPGSGRGCKICGAETPYGTLCESCRLKMLSAQMQSERQKEENSKENIKKTQWVPLSYRENTK